MKILIVNQDTIPVKKYGGTSRIVWYLGKELSKLGHEVIFLVGRNSYCDFAKVIFIDNTKNLIEQIPADIDVVHFNEEPKDIEQLDKPYVITVHGSIRNRSLFNKNSVFISKTHAQRYCSDSFVYNGLDWSDYIPPDFSMERKYFHFLAKASWKVKNVQGAIDVIKNTPNEKLKVLGGHRLNFKMGFRFTLSPRVTFNGMVGGEKKDRLLNGSKGLIFPVKWPEPFGLAIIESLFYGCPVFGTPYGSLPEIVTEDFGYLSNNTRELADALLESNTYNKRHCHEYVVEKFNSKQMAIGYLEKYEQVINNKPLNLTNPQLPVEQPNRFLEWN